MAVFRNLGVRLLGIFVKLLLYSFSKMMKYTRYFLIYPDKKALYCNSGTLPFMETTGC